MKYIRTKDGHIFEIVDYEQLDENTKESVRQPRYVGLEDYLNEKIFVKIYKNMPHPISQYQSIKMFDILKQSNTIEELCDEFVLEHPLFANNCKNLYHSLEKAKNGIKKRSGDAHDLYSFEIYGAIWTDKGLIYVAKMNDKGELELL